MEHNTRPVIEARLLERDGKWYLENHIVSVEIKLNFLQIVKELYSKSNGHTELQNLALGYPDDDIIGFFSVLEDLGLAFDVLEASMSGHRYSNYPDQFRPTLSNAEILDLQVLAKDQSIGLIEIGLIKDQSDLARATCRDFQKAPFDKTDFFQIVLSAYGIVSSTPTFSRRAVPSAGAMYPLVHDFFVQNVSGLSSGLYRLASQRNALYKRDTDTATALEESFFDSDWVAAGVVHVISFDIKRSSAKYGGRAHRFAILEAGHSAQNAMRKATELKIGSWEYGGYKDQQLQGHLGLNTPTSGVATTIFYGKAKS